METSNVDPAIIGVWRWQASITTLILTIGTGVVSFPLDSWPAIPALMALAGILIVWFWPPLCYRHLRFGVDPTGIVIERGVLWRSRIALPRSRIQHTDVSQGPLQRRFGVGTLKLYTAGSRYTQISLPGLTHSEAIALRDALLAEGRLSGV